MLAGQVATFTNTLAPNLQTLIANNPFIYPYLVDFCRNNGAVVSSQNRQKIIQALTNFNNFLANFNPTNLTNANIERFKFWAFYSFLNNNPLDANTTKINEIKDFILDADYEPANAIIDYLYENLITDYVKLENLYMSQVEGKDFHFDSNFWNNPNLTFIPQNLPTWNNYNDAYPRNADGSYMTGADNVYGYVGGDVLQARLDHPTDTNNSCALKVSIALNGAGVIIPNIPNQTLEGGGVNSGKYYFLNAAALNEWMEMTFGVHPANQNHRKFVSDSTSTAAEKFNAFIEANSPTHGIYTMLPYNATEFEASGHCDIFDGTECAAGCYLGAAAEINLWILN